MKTLLSGLSLMLLLSFSTGCYCCRQSYDPCGGSSYVCKEWGFAIFNRGCGCRSDGGCDAGCDTCEMPCDGGYGYPSPGPAPTFQQNMAPPATPDAAPATDETTGWAPSTARYPVRPVAYPGR